MVAKISHGRNIMGVLSYNALKVQQERGSILLAHKIVEAPEGSFTTANLLRSFEPYLSANRRTERPVLHISLNPDPKDSVSDGSFQAIATQYMQEMGYGHQPFVVFKHTDTGRVHIHIVTVCVDEEGRKISDAFERRRSMDICRRLEQQYELVPAAGKSRLEEDKIFRPVDHREGDIKSQIAAVVRHLPLYYRFQGFGGYNALLSLFNITAAEVSGELRGRPCLGLVYFALDEQGEKVSNPFKASLFGKAAGDAQLQKYYDLSRESLKGSAEKLMLKGRVGEVMQQAPDEAVFRQLLADRGISTVVRRNAGGRVYGVTFIDHNSRSVWNGSQLGKEFAANAFQERWSEGKDRIGPEQESDVKLSPLVPGREVVDLPEDLFRFLENDQSSDLGQDSSLMEALGSLLPQTWGEDREEQEFNKRMKKRKRRRSGGGNEPAGL